MKLKLLLCSALLGASLTSHGVLVLNVNTVNDTFYFTGEDTGTLDSEGFRLNYRRNADYVLPVESVLTYGVDVTNADASPDSDLDYGRISVYDSENIIFLLDIDQSTSDPYTLVGLGSDFAVSYTSLGTELSAIFEDAAVNGVTLELLTASSFSPITMQAVPEPSSVALFLALGSAGALWFRTRSRRK